MPKGMVTKQEERLDGPNATEGEYLWQILTELKAIKALLEASPVVSGDVVKLRENYIPPASARRQ